MLNHVGYGLIKGERPKDFSGPYLVIRVGNAPTRRTYIPAKNREVWEAHLMRTLGKGGFKIGKR